MCEMCEYQKNKSEQVLRNFDRIVSSPFDVVEMHRLENSPYFREFINDLPPFDPTMSSLITIKEDYKKRSGRRK